MLFPELPDCYPAPPQGEQARSGDQPYLGHRVQLPSHPQPVQVPQDR